jgi:hypothetical protein
MFELEALIAMGVGAALVAVAPLVVGRRPSASPHQRHQRCWPVPDQAGTQGWHLHCRSLFVCAVAREVEAGESFTDLLAEAKANLEQAKAAKKRLTPCNPTGCGCGIAAPQIAHRLW